MYATAGLASNDCIGIPREQRPGKWLYQFQRIIYTAMDAPQSFRHDFGTY